VAPEEVLVIDAMEKPFSFKPAVPRLGTTYSKILLMDWRDLVILTRAAVRRYLKGCQLAGARRLLLEWGFSGRQTPSSKRRRPDAAELDAWMEAKAAKRDQTLRDCCDQTGATWRDADAAWKRLRFKRGLKQGQKMAAKIPGR
jgi:hypothetical protein